MPHVPKFGNWDSDNIPYTTYFEEARNEKDKGAKMFNPNDPQENPNAFSHWTVGLEDDVVQALQSHPNSGSIEHVTKRKENYQDREETHVRRSPSTESGLNQQSKPKSPTAESASDISSSDRSLLQSTNHRTRSSQKKSPGGGVNSNSFPPPSPPSRVKVGSGRSADHQHQQHHRVASVPKFGAWDETDPRSGEGFTIIFNKVKQEKQNGATRFPTAVPELSVYPNGQKHETSPSKAKICCCFFSRSDK
ncbi:hypothetical protein ACHQM5_025574 [Ranunculus cassubicifolius]